MRKGRKIFFNTQTYLSILLKNKYFLYYSHSYQQLLLSLPYNSKQKTMTEEFNFDTRLIFAILNGKVSAAINQKLYNNFKQGNLNINPEQWTVLLSLWEKDGVTQQELCNETSKDKPSMTRLINNMEKMHLVVRIASKTDKRYNMIYLTKNGRELEEIARFIANRTLKEALNGLSTDELRISQNVLRKILSNIKD